MAKPPASAFLEVFESVAPDEAALTSGCDGQLEPTRQALAPRPDSARRIPALPLEHIGRKGTARPTVRAAPSARSAGP